MKDKNTFCELNQSSKCLLPTTKVQDGDEGGVSITEQEEETPRNDMDSNIGR